MSEETNWEWEQYRTAYPLQTPASLDFLEAQRRLAFIAGQSSIPELPPVSPEDLVDGEWYVVKNRQDHGGKLTVAQCKMETMRFDEIECDMIDCDPYPVLWIVGAEFHFRPERFDSIYGPLRFKIGGAE